MSGHVLAVLSGLGAMGWRRVGHEQPQGLADHLYASKDGILCWLLICAALIVGESLLCYPLSRSHHLCSRLKDLES